MDLIEKLTNIANAIRNKTGKTGKMTLDQMVEEVEGISSLKKMLGARRSAKYLFLDYSGNSVDSLIKESDTENVLDTVLMFNNCSALETIPLLNTSNVTNMYEMFKKCLALKTIPLIDTHNVKSMYGMFHTCSSLTSIPLLDTSNVTNMELMFNECNTLTTIPSLDTSNVQNMASLFNRCISLVSIPLLDTRNVTTTYKMFSQCTSLETVPSLDMRNVTNAGNMFHYCSCLTECWIRNIKVNLTVGSGTSYGHLLTVESLIHLINELRDTGSSKTLTVGSANLEKLAPLYVKTIEITDEMRTEDDLIDEKLPCVLCESTDEGAMTISDYAVSKNWTIA